MQEQLMEELDRLMTKMNKLDPTSETYQIVRRSYLELAKVLHEDVSACEEDLNGRFTRSLKEAEKELDERKQKLAEQESKSRWKMAKLEALVSLGKTILTIIGAIVAIFVTGSLEETTILSSKCLAWIKLIFPRT